MYYQPGSYSTVLVNVTFCNDYPATTTSLTRRLAIGGGLRDKGMALEYRVVNRI